MEWMLLATQVILIGQLAWLGAVIVGLGTILEKIAEK